jgi:hypothetical protein
MKFSASAVVALTSGAAAYLAASSNAFVLPTTNTNSINNNINNNNNKKVLVPINPNRPIATTRTPFRHASSTSNTWLSSTTADKAETTAETYE